MEILASHLIKCGVSAKRAETYAPIITRHSDCFGINNKMRMCHFLAQVLHESCCFIYTKEIASGKAYEGRKDLGNVIPGDGVKYKGRGLIQVTGRSNYGRCSQYFGVDFISRPELMEEPEWAVRTAMWFWSNNGLNERADRDELTNITRVINGGLNGKKQRLAYLGKAKRAFGLLK